jgi:DNA-directed RNA polymerase subunit RPC12/RpoP
MPSYDRRIHGPWKYLHNMFGKKCIGMVCDDCRHTVDLDMKAKIEQDPHIPCPNCGARKTEEETSDHEDQ